MRKRLIGIAIVCVVALAGAACGGDGGDAVPTAAPTPESIDPRVLAQAILREDDLPAGFTTGTDVSAAGKVGLVAESISLNGTIHIQSSVVWMPTLVDAEQSLARQRGVWIDFGWQEQNDEVEGTQAAFRYTKAGVSGFAELTINEQFVIFVQMASSDPSQPDPAAGNEEEFDRLNTLVAERVAAIMAGDITPVAGTPVQVSSVVPGLETPEATP